TAFGLFRIGWVAYLMSRPVLTGFTNAAAILIVASQLPIALGVQAQGAGLLGQAWWALSHVHLWEPAVLLLSIVTIALVLGGRRLHPLFPGVLVAAAIGVGVSLVAGYPGPVVGHIPSGLPPFSLEFPWSSLPSLILPGVVIALVGFAEPAAIARIYAAQDRQPWSPNREFLSQGVANLASGISAAFPVGGSFSRSSVNRMSGGKTRWSGAVTGLVVLAFLPVAGILAPLPRAVLAAIVIAAVLKLITLRQLAKLTRYSFPQALVAWVTFAATLTLAPRIERAVLLGVGLAILIHLWRELSVHIGTDYEDETLRLTPHGVLFFASAPGLEEALITQLAAHPSANRLVVDLAQLGRIDYSGAIALKNVIEEAEQAGLAVEMVGIPPQARRILTNVFGADSPLFD
ncbi:MAG TPA: SulP family inorganic anion transporter, partial [Gemmatimonadales bacterium]|nr:SulP family inorganic anion transporter [Gemmatimonadales bacterium]